jgi:hypothetical protein
LADVYSNGAAASGKASFFDLELPTFRE